AGRGRRQPRAQAPDRAHAEPAVRLAQRLRHGAGDAAGGEQDPHHRPGPSSLRRARNRGPRRCARRGADARARAACPPQPSARARQSGHARPRAWRGTDSPVGGRRTLLTIRFKQLRSTTTMQRTKPPFRADIVGSFLRTQPIKEARVKREKGAITAGQLREVEDREIEKVVRKQEEIGLKLATDGEFRRSWWHFDFFGMLDGVEVIEGKTGIQFQGVLTKPHVLHITNKIDFSDHPMLEHFKFLKAHTKVTPKMTIPSPAVMHFRLEPDAVDKGAYKSRDDIFDDLAAAYQKAVKAFYDAGCRYLQFDDTAWAYLCSQEELKKAKARGLDVDHLQESYTRCINKALEAKPADMTITTHVCRGNFRSTFISSGGYEPVAQSLLAKCNYDGYFLEYD